MFPTICSTFQHLIHLSREAWQYSKYTGKDRNVRHWNRQLHAHAPQNEDLPNEPLLCVLCSRYKYHPITPQTKMGREEQKMKSGFSNERFIS